MTPQHIIMVGAARSGTKAFRDVLAIATGVGKVPYDIGYVWRVGNESCPHDAIPAAAVSGAQARFIRRFIDKYASINPPVVIEKTVGNALRVPTVVAVLPDAKFIHLIRDGVDVIESTRRQWQAPTDLRYLARKARHFPLRLAPTYGLKYARSLAHRRADGEERVGSWGPRYIGMDEDLRASDLLSVCARQWRQSVLCASADLEQIGANVVEVRYEHLVRDPTAELARVAELVGLSTSAGGLASAAATITRNRQGTGRKLLTSEELETVDAEVGDVLTQLGYERATPEPHSNEPSKG